MAILIRTIHLMKNKDADEDTTAGLYWTMRKSIRRYRAQKESSDFASDSPVPNSGAASRTLGKVLGPEAVSAGPSGDSM